MLEKLVGIIAPFECIECRTEGSLLCAWCLPDAVDLIPDRCYKCHVVSPDSAVCSKCRQDSPLRYVWVRSQYELIAKDLVYKLKFGRSKAAAKVVAELLDEAIPALPQHTVVTYVSTATSRVRVRGYDQSRLIAREFAKQRGLKFANVLVRHGQSRQVGADKKHRQNQASSNYSVRNVVKDLEVLLVDDITTTGATLESAAKKLKQAGAKQINAAVFAQKQ